MPVGKSAGQKEEAPMNTTASLDVAEIAGEADDLGGISYYQVLWSIPDAVCVVDKEGRLLFVNQAYTRILNVPANVAVGRKLEEIAPSAHTLRVLRTGEPIQCDSYYSDDVGVGLVMSATPIFKHGELAGVVTVFRTSKEMLDIYAAYRRANGLVDYYQQLLSSEKGRADCFKAVIGHDRTLAKIVGLSAKVAETDTTVLITGENGVGKDILAQAIHQASQRCRQPFIVVNCAAIPDTLLESELFGFENGTFTGAARGGRPGKFELAEGGTIFLDEIGDMSSSMQAKVLRVLQQKEVQKIGSNRVIRVNVRVIAATNRDLGGMVREGQFRADLLYRLNVFPIAIPPLRERKSDIPKLAQLFLDQCSEGRGKRVMISPEAFEALERQDWPGNIRQLRNAVERAVILCDGDLLLPEHFGLSDVAEPSPSAELQPNVARAQEGLKERIRELERKAYEDALSGCGGNKSKAMQKLGVSRRTFYKRLHEFSRA
jgi:transcriptional regulator with PAS, ATPase and Fis domain